MIDRKKVRSSEFGIRSSKLENLTLISNLIKYYLLMLRIDAVSSCPLPNKQVLLNFGGIIHCCSKYLTNTLEPDTQLQIDRAIALYRLIYEAFLLEKLNLILQNGQ